MPRLGHKKSRLGCRQCKARHVKCDELKPCSNCARHGALCSLVTWDSNASQPASNAQPASSVSASGRPKQQPHVDNTATSSSALSPSLHIDYVLNPETTAPVEQPSAPPISDTSSPASQPDNFPFLSHFLHRTKSDQTDLWVRDLELMHHWTVEAYDALSQRNDMRFVWRVEAPKQAIAHMFLMHEILAFAAFHKAHKQPEQRPEYYSFGVYHQDLAIRGVREKLQSITTHEAVAILATSTLLTFSIFASTGFEANFSEPAHTQSAIEGILNIFNLMQGMGNLLPIAHQAALDAWLAPMFFEASELVPPQPRLQELMKHIPTLTIFVQAKLDLTEADRKVYLDAIADLQPILAASMPSRVDNRELRFLFTWAQNCHANFLTHVRQRRSGALVVLMYYATVLFAAEPRYWFMEGWGDRLMRACYDEIDQSWIPVLQWPLSILSSATSQQTAADWAQERQRLVDPSRQPLLEETLVSIPVRQQPSSLDG